MPWLRPRAGRLTGCLPALPPLRTHNRQGDVKGEGGLDDATGTNKFGGGASMKQTSAVVNLTSIKEDDDEEKVRQGWEWWRGRKGAATAGDRGDTQPSSFLEAMLLLPAGHRLPHSFPAHCHVVTSVQGLWGMKGLNFKLPAWVIGKNEEKEREKEKK